MYGKSSMETYITICKIVSQQEFVVWLRELKQVLCINLEGGMKREKGGRKGRKQDGGRERGGRGKTSHSLLESEWADL